MENMILGLRLTFAQTRFLNFKEDYTTVFGESSKYPILGLDPAPIQVNGKITDDFNGSRIEPVKCHGVLKKL